MNNPDTSNPTEYLPGKPEAKLHCALPERPEKNGHPIELSDEERTRCEVWTRVMGYHRPVAAFNTGKKGEHAERRYFVEGKARATAPLRP